MPEEGVGTVSPIPQPCGRPHVRPSNLHADKTYDHHRRPQAPEPQPHRTLQHREQRQAGSAPVGRQAQPDLFGQFRPLAIRNKRRPNIHTAFLTLASAIIAWRFVLQGSC